MDTLDNSRPEIITCSLNNSKFFEGVFLEWAPLWVVRKNCFILKHQHWSGNLQGTSAELLHLVCTGLDLPLVGHSCQDVI